MNGDSASKPRKVPEIFRQFAVIIHVYRDLRIYIQYTCKLSNGANNFRLMSVWWRIGHRLGALVYAIARGPKPPLEEALVYNDGEQRADPVDERVARDARLAARRGLHAGVHRIRVHSGRVAPHRRRPRAQHVHQRCGRLIRACPRAFKKMEPNILL